NCQVGISDKSIARDGLYAGDILVAHCHDFFGYFSIALGTQEMQRRPGSRDTASRSGSDKRRGDEASRWPYIEIEACHCVALLIGEKNSRRRFGTETIFMQIRRQ